MLSFVRAGSGRGRRDGGNFYRDEKWGQALAERRELTGKELSEAQSRKKKTAWKESRRSLGVAISRLPKKREDSLPYCIRRGKKHGGDRQDPRRTSACLNSEVIRGSKERDFKLCSVHGIFIPEKKES